MTKSDLINALTLYPEIFISKERTTQIVDTFFNTIKEGLKRGERVEIRRWGIWERRSIKAHQAHNPKTGVRVNVPEKYKPFFKASHFLKKLINEERK